ncbi:MAG: type II and III secretion system protein, partial [gamma proteobacterium symbiont of Bathyaustriella thionipta]|nr:type II and III secretion system protein [gamma proteobacterium symbiont of Bathyaustriella thionipta]
IKQGLSAIEGQTEGGDAGLNPTFTNQEINTSVVVRDGETIILGGLIETVEADGESGVPVLKDVPLMGNLFKSQGTQMERRELILIISTKIVNPEGDYDDFNNTFKNRYYAAASYLDKEMSDNKPGNKE